VALQISGAAAFSRAGEARLQVGHEGGHALAIGLEDGVARVDARLERYHPQQSVL
jgi:hypothetical protein